MSSQDAVHAYGMLHRTASVAGRLGDRAVALRVMKIENDKGALVCTIDSSAYIMVITKTNYIELAESTVIELPKPPLRQQLIAAMGMGYDPLINSVSESDPAPDFGEIYVDPKPSLLDMLKRPASTLVFADYGMGKSATRLALEHTLRNSYEAQPALCVTYTPHLARLDELSSDAILSQHLAAITTELATDLIIQLLERRNLTASMLSDAQAAALQRQAHALPLRVRHRIRDAAAQADRLPDGICWKDIRAVVRYVAVTPQWRELIDRIAGSFVSGAPRPVSWEQALADTQTLGFRHVFLLIDAVDEGVSTLDALRGIVEPLFNAIEQFHSYNVLIKCFLPSDLEELFQTQYKKRFQGLTVPVEIATITEAPIDYLVAIVNERLQAAGTSDASYRGLDWLKGPDLAESIQAHLALLARGSPRRMIELASQLLDFHSTHGFKEDKRLWLTAAEWHSFVRWLETLSLASPG